MLKIVLYFCSLLLILLFTLVDKAWAGIFGIFAFFSLSCLTLMIFLNKSKTVNPLLLFFFAGVLVDWFHKKTLGWTSLIFVFFALIFQIVHFKFAGSRWTISFMNFISSYFLFYFYRNGGAFFDLRLLVAAIINSVMLTLILKFY